MSQSKLKSLLYVLSIPLSLITLVGGYIGFQVLKTELQSKEVTTPQVQTEQISAPAQNVETSSQNTTLFAKAVKDKHDLFNKNIDNELYDHFNDTTWKSFMPKLNTTYSVFQSLLDNGDVPKDAEKDIQNLLKVIEITKEKKDTLGLLYAHRILHDLDKEIGSNVNAPFFGATYFANKGDVWNLEKIENYVK